MRWLILILVICRFGLIGAASAQSNDSLVLRKNSIFMSPGSSLYYSELKSYYERIVIQNRQENNRLVAVGFQIGFGIYNVEGFGTSNSFTPKVVLLAGSEMKFLEITLGANLFYKEYEYTESESFIPVVSVGFRQHFFKDRLLFRIGGGWPMGAYVGLGVRF